jgi:magnesium-transporting ATPase (P-type)
MWKVCLIHLTYSLHCFKYISHPNHALFVYLFRWVKITGTELLPGDIVSIGRSPSGEDRSVPADMLLMAGSAIVNEAILTGESTPQWKVFLYRPTLPLIRFHPASSVSNLVCNITSLCHSET